MYNSDELCKVNGILENSGANDDDGSSDGWDSWEEEDEVCIAHFPEDLYIHIVFVLQQSFKFQRYNLYLRSICVLVNIHFHATRHLRALLCFGCFLEKKTTTNTPPPLLYLHIKSFHDCSSRVLLRRLFLGKGDAAIVQAIAEHLSLLHRLFNTCCLKV